MNNFLALCTGELDRKNLFFGAGSHLHKVIADRWIMGGDLVNRDGTGNITVYGKDTIESEQNNLRFSEPYLLAASANDEGQIGSQFFITLD